MRLDSVRFTIEVGFFDEVYENHRKKPHEEMLPEIEHATKSDLQNYKGFSKKACAVTQLQLPNLVAPRLNDQSGECRDELQG
jgi:hypothetical protein